MCFILPSNPKFKVFNLQPLATEKKKKKFWFEDLFCPLSSEQSFEFSFACISHNLPTAPMHPFTNWGIYRLEAVFKVVYNLFTWSHISEIIWQIDWADQDAKLKLFSEPNDLALSVFIYKQKKKYNFLYNQQKEFEK